MRPLPQSLRRALSALLCAFLLFAEQAALTHVVSHAPATSTHEQQGLDQGGGHSSPGFAGLCAFDAAFGQVLSGGPASQHTSFVDTAAAPPAFHAHGVWISAHALSPRSRGPPILL